MYERPKRIGKDAMTQSEVNGLKSIVSILKSESHRLFHHRVVGDKLNNKDYGEIR